MSKDVVIAGVIVAACLGLVTVAFVVPRHKAPATDIVTDTVPSEPIVTDLTPTTPGVPNDPFAGTDPFAPNLNNLSTPNTIPNNNGTTALNNNTGSNPFAPPGNSFTPISDFPPTQQPTLRNSFPTPNLPPVGPVDPIPLTPPTTEVRTHTVAAGETLGEISQKYYNTARNWKKIAEANKVDPSELKVGQKITIPVLETTTSTTTGTPVELASGERSYTLKKGDSYYSIAKQELGNAARWKEIEKLNNIPAEELRVGKTIKLPSKEAAVTSITKSPTLDSTSGSDSRVHVVASGETLMDISKKHYGTTAKWKDIIKANPGVDPEGLKVGQKLNLPDIAGVSPTSSNNDVVSGTPESSGTYTVQAGDTTLAKIAEKELGSSKDWPKIVEANPGLDPRKLRIGQKLIIPGKSGSSNSNAGGTTSPASTGTGFGTTGNSGFGGPTNNNGFGGPTNNNSFGGPTNNNGFGGPTNNNSFGAPANNNNFGAGPNNSTPPANNSFGPSNTLPPNNGLGTTPAYPAPTTTPPPSGSGAFPPASTLPDTFGGASGFGNPQ